MEKPTTFAIMILRNTSGRYSLIFCFISCEPCRYCIERPVYKTGGQRSVSARKSGLAAACAHAKMQLPRGLLHSFCNAHTSSLPLAPPSLSLSVYLSFRRPAVLGVSLFLAPAAGDSVRAEFELLPCAHSVAKPTHTRAFGRRLVSRATERENASERVPIANE